MRSGFLSPGTISPDGAFLSFSVFQLRSLTTSTLWLYDRLRQQFSEISPGSAASGVAANAMAIATFTPLDPRDINASSDIYMAVAIPSRLPGAPQALTATVTGSTVTLAWTPPARSDVATYIIEAGSSWGAANLGRLATGNARPAMVVSNAPAGFYYVRVRAVNASGAGPPSNEIFVSVGR